MTINRYPQRVTCSLFLNSLGNRARGVRNAGAHVKF
jgi:hypothetical protein